MWQLEEMKDFFFSYLATHVSDVVVCRLEAFDEVLKVSSALSDKNEVIR